jgi:predicted alpha/beta hydrolase family esterase
MRTSEADILIVPGWSDSGADHWQSRWERNLRTARRIEQEDWLRPSRDAWVGRILTAAAGSARPVILVAHSVGVAAVAHAARKMPNGLVAGAFLVAPADVDAAERWPETEGETFDVIASGFAPLPLEPLPFPAILVASSNDPYCEIARARQLADAWGATFVDAGALGHINAASGHGPWPEGLLRFGGFLSGLGRRYSEMH